MPGSSASDRSPCSTSARRASRSSATTGSRRRAYGATWWTFERRYGLTFTPVTTSWLAGGNLSEFNVIVIPSGSSGTLNGVLGKGGADRLRTWMQSGGTLITMGGASAWATRSELNLSSARLVGPEPDAKPDTTGFQTPKADTTPASVRARQSERASAGIRPVDELLAVTSPGASNATPIGLPGSHVDIVLDRTHWLTFGYDNPRMTVLMEGSNFLTLSKEGANVGVFPSTGALVRSGFSWPDNTERLLKGTAFLIHEPVGGGHLVMFANDPFFRGWWRALDKAVMNAILLGPGY